MSDCERHWGGVLRDWRRSGLSRAAFCRRRGIRYSSLSYWKQRLDAASRPASGSGRGRFVEVAVQPMARMAGYEIVLCGGRVVRVPPDFEIGSVARLIAAVEGTPPTVAPSC